MIRNGIKISAVLVALLIGQQQLPNRIRKFESYRKK
jgi:hypothetical protein